MRVTGRGYGVLAAGVVLLVAGFVFGYAELATLGCAALVATAAALVFVTWRPQLSLTRVAEPDRVQRGEASVVTLAVANASRFFGASLIARDQIALGPRPLGTVAVPLVRLRPGRTTDVRYPVPTRRRGVIRVGPLEIARKDPLGLLSVVRRYGDSVTVWVHPRVHPITAVPVGLSRSMDGRVDRVPQGNLTFSTLREYVVGDDLRHVHWRTSARVGELMVREHVDTSLPRLVVLLDDRASAHVVVESQESTFEAACEAAASVLVAAVREDIPVELRLVSGPSSAARREAELGPVLDLLAEATLHDAAPASPGAPADPAAGPSPDAAPAEPPAPGAGTDEALHTAVLELRGRRVGDTLIFLSGPPDVDDLGQVAGLRGAYPSIIAGVFGPVETGLATDAGMLVVSCVDGADFARTWDGIRAW